MMKRTRSVVVLAVLLMLAAGGMAFLMRNTASAQGRDKPHPKSEKGGVGAVYALTNAPARNEVVIYRRAADGELALAGRIATGGRGTGPQADREGLGSQGALTLSEGNEWLLAVNGGSNDISVFKVLEGDKDDLVLTDKVPSGGIQPVSVTIHEDLVYVLNDGANASGGPGDAGNITGFVLSPQGKLTKIAGSAGSAGSTRPLSGSGTDPATIRFNRDGSVLMVTEKATNIIDTYTVGDNRLATGPMTHVSPGMTPFGFSLSQRNRAVVAEAHGDQPGLGSASSYILSDDGSLLLVSGAMSNGQTASCWVAITNNGRYAYVSNTGSDTISSYRVARNGSITLAQAVAARTDTTPREVDLTDNSRYLYVLNTGAGTVGAYRVEPNGSLTHLQNIGGLPAHAGAEGLAAR